MDIFKNQILVYGNIIGGLIKNEKFILNKISTSNIHPPITERSFTKESLGILISELEAIKRKM